MKESYVKELARITGCDENASLNNIYEKAENVYANLLGIANMSTSGNYNFKIVEFPGLNLQDSLILNEIYTVYQTDDYVRSLIEYIVVAANAPRIIGVVNEQAEEDSCGVFKYNTMQEKYLMISTICMNIHERIGCFDASKNASYVTWIHSCLKGWAQMAEWTRFQEIHEVKSSKETWTRVKRGIELCTERKLPLTKETVWSAIVDAEREDGYPYGMIQKKTVANALAEILKGTTLSLDYTYGPDTEDGDSSMNDRLTNYGTVYSRGTEEYDLATYDYDEDETPELDRLREEFRRRASRSEELRWFAEYIYKTFRDGAEFKDAATLIRRALRQYQKETGCSESKREKLKSRFERFLTPVSEPQIIKRSETISGAENEQSLDEIWADILSMEAKSKAEKMGKPAIILDGQSPKEILKELGL